MGYQQALADVAAALTEVNDLHDAFVIATTKLQDVTAKLQDITAQVTPPPPPPPPPPSPPPPTEDPRLVALQAQIGADKVGVYTGIETFNDAPAAFAEIASTLQAYGADFALVKMGEGSATWHNGDFASIRQAFFAHGLGCAPYWYCLPQGGQAQIDACIHLAQQFKLLILDCEDEYAGHDAELADLLNALAVAAPSALIIVSGYGDPITRFGPHGWPFHTVATAAKAVYQPQAYFGVWDVYNQHGVDAALQWCDNECAAAFGQAIVLQPAINVQGVKSLADFEAAGRYWKSFKASVVLWEYQQVTAQIVAAVKKGLHE